MKTASLISLHHPTYLVKMRFALVAGALVLGATVAEGRSVAPSPSKRTAEKMEFPTPSRTPSKRARHEDDGGDWNPVTESDDGPAAQVDTKGDPSTFQNQTPTARNTMRAKKAHKQHEMDSTYRTALPDFLGETAAPVTETLTDPKMRQAMQYEIIPVPPANSSSSDSPSAAESRAYIIKPVAPVPAVDPVEAVTKPTVDGTISNSDLAGMVDHLKTKEDFKPAMALLRAIENYRQAVSEESSHPDAPKDSHSSSNHNNSSSSDPFSSANGNATLADAGSSDQ